MAGRLRARGFEATVDGRRLVVGPGDETLENEIVQATASTSAGLVRMIRGSASLEDLFLTREGAK